MKRFHIVALLFLLPLLTGCSFSLAGDVTPPPEYRPPSTELVQPAAQQEPLNPVVAPDPQKGMPIYAEKCAPCHGDRGLGDGPDAARLPNPVAAIGSPEVARKSIPAEWARIIRDGKMDRFMPAFDSISESRRWDVIAYVYSLSAPAETVARGKELYQGNCAACHGESGKGDGLQAAGSTMPDFSDQAGMTGKSTASLYEAITAGVAPAMPGYADKMPEQDRWALADYIRWLSFSSAGGPAVVAANPPGNGTPGVTPEPQSTAVVTATEALTGTQTTGTVTGQILNGSGGEAPSDLEVTLHGFDNMQLAISNTVTVDPDGTFTFPELAMPVGRSFLATTRVGQATYSSDVGTVQAGQDKINLKITVYDTTTDPSQLSVDRMHIFFDFSQPGKAQVIELYIISNRGSKTVISAQENGPVVEFPLPQGAENLKFQDGALGERYLQTPAGFADTTQVRPSTGEYQVLFAFDMPFDRKLELSQPVNLPADNVVVLFPQDGIRLKSDSLRDDGTRDVQGVAYQIYSGNSMKAGSTLSLSLSGRPGSRSLLSYLGDRSSLVLGLGALGLVLVVVGLVLYRRGQNQEPEEESGLPEEEPGEDTTESLMDAIIALDDLYQEGRLPEEAYQARRAELKERLSQLEES